MSDIEYQSEILCNRISKRYKHLKKWAKRTNVSSFRLYDRDIPEIPLAIDLYEGIPILNGEKISEKRFLPQNCQTYLVFYLYERPYQKDEKEEQIWLNTISLDIATLLNISSENIILKMRKKQKGTSQYNKNEISTEKKKILITEQGQKFIVDLSSYIDTGLFFDHRPLRKIISEKSANKSILNLYCYTGSFSVYAASGNAKSVTSVDLSNTYINWAKENMEANGFIVNDEKYKFEVCDVVSFLKNDKNRYDIIILDPPTFSNSKKTQEDLDINRDWANLIRLCCKHLNENGVLYFSTNSHRLKFDESLLPQGFVSYDITNLSIPEDFRNKKIHRCWEIRSK